MKKSVVSIYSLGLGLWLVLIGFGIGYLNIYSNTPGEKADASMLMPTISKVATTRGLPTLILFLHPKCSCSQATLAELERLLPRIIGKAAIDIVFLRPEGFSESDIKGSLWNRANRISDVNVIIDSTNVEARVFGAKTSGQTFVYDSNAHLVFEGGLTAGRGHEGISVGQQAILDFFMKPEIGTVARAPVFGCSLGNVNSIVSNGVQ